MKVQFTTESGSTYILDSEAMTWSRLDGVTKIRTTGGKFLGWPEVKVGKPVNIVGPALTPGADCRLITTSPVRFTSELAES